MNLQMFLNEVYLHKVTDQILGLNRLKYDYEKVMKCNILSYFSLTLELHIVINSWIFAPKIPFDGSIYWYQKTIMLGGVITNFTKNSKLSMILILIYKVSQ